MPVKTENAATPTRSSKEARTSAILDAARAVFEEAGYENAKMSEIARRVGVVEGTVFHHFSTKKQLMARVIEDFYREITAELQDGLQGIEGTRNRLRYIIHFHLQVITRNSRLCGEILRESRGLDDSQAEAVHRLNQDYTRCLYDVLKAGVDSGELSDRIPISTIRNSVYGSLEHLLWTIIDNSSQVDIEAESAALTSLVYRGAAADKPLVEHEISSLVTQLNTLLASREHTT